jgi:hypothetical protein
VDRPVLQIGGEVTKGRPKSRAGDRKIWLDAATVALLRAHSKQQVADRLRVSSAWQEDDLVFCRADGSPWTPDYVTHHFKKLAAAAGVPVNKLHEGAAQRSQPAARRRKLTRRSGARPSVTPTRR